MKERIEFNMHSNYSRMNGVNSVKEIIDRAKKLGMDTIAITDIGSVKGLPEAYNYAKRVGIKLILGMEAFFRDGRIYCEAENEDNFNRIVILVKDTDGRKNLYKLISEYYKNGYAELKNRDGLLIGLYSAFSDIIAPLVVYQSDNKIIEKMKPYDFILVDPQCYHKHNERIVSLADKTETLVIASNSPYYLDKNDAIARETLRYADDKDPEYAVDSVLYFTKEMLDAFSYLGERAKEVVIDNGYKLAEMIYDDVPPVPHGTFYPNAIQAFKEVKDMAYSKATDKYKIIVTKYSHDLPEPVKTRLKKEIGFLEKYKEFALPFWIAMKLVNDSEEKGCPVVSRAYAGSSFIAYLLGITHTNPLPPHYRCAHSNYRYNPCYHTEFVDGYESGFDLPAKKCRCGRDMRRDGHNIPYETIFGFDGDKEPYIDLNFCHSFHNDAVQLIKEMFGSDNVINAGGGHYIKPYDIAKPLVEKYLDDTFKEKFSNEEKEAIIKNCSGAFYKSAVHPVCYYIIPDGMELEDFTPLEYAEDYNGNRVAITHILRNDLNCHLLSVDLLRHDTPDLLKKLKEKTGVEPAENDIADNEQLLKALKDKNTDMIPEMATEYVKKMIDTTKPEKFSDYVVMNGLAHGADTYEDNAEDLFKSGTCDFSNVIAFREDIFLYLDKKRKEYAEKTGSEPPLSYHDCYKISEITRKGRALRDFPEYEDAMKEIGVPDWYIESTKKIRYLFPKAHSVEYMIASFKLLWYKLNYPEEYFEAYNELYDDVIPTGITGLDVLHEGGFHKGDLSIIASRPAMGKSTFALQLASSIAKGGKKVCFFSMEMPERMVKERLAKQSNAEVPVIIEDSSNITPKEIREKIKAENADVAFIDYFGLIFPDEKKEKRIEECADIAFELRKIAEELNVSIVCLAQLSRYKDSKPKLNNLLLEIEQEASLVMFLHRDSYFLSEDDNQEDCSNITEIIVEKNKYGITFKIETVYDSERQVFIEKEL